MEGREEKKLRNRKKRKIQEEGSGFPRRSERLRLKETGGGQSRGQLKGAMLVLGLLSVLVPQSKESKVDNADYEVLQGLLKGMAAGVEFAESVAVSVELLKIREASQGRQRLFDLTSRVIEDALRKLERKRSAQMELAGTQPNCTTIVAELGELNMGKEVIFRLQIMGVFTLCYFLATLGWGRGVTSILVITAKAWSTEPIKESMDASTNTDVPGNRGISRPLKPAAVSFRDKRARWEWPRRAMSVGRRIRGTHTGSVNNGQAGWGECIRHKESKAASLPRRAEEMKM
jgi:hypothetical protein